MKNRFKLIVFAVTFLCFGTAYGQNEFLAITSSQLLKGLNDKDYLSKILTEDGFSLTKKWGFHKQKSGIYEYWQFKSVVFVDVISNPGTENYIIVRVHKDYNDVSERLIQTFPQKKNRGYNDQLRHFKVANLSKESAYNLSYSTEGQNVGVAIWFEDPFYFFQYSSWQ